MSKTTQWILGVCAVAITLTVVLGMLAPWLAAAFGWQTGFGPFGGWVGMMGRSAPGWGAYGMMGRSPSGWGSGGMMGGGMMGGALGSAPWPPSGSRISLEQARSAAEQSVAAAGNGLAVVEVMEFENNFYAIVQETATGQGAFELLVDPYSSAVSYEPGPNMMWNDRYGHMASGGGENRLTMEAARQFAQQALDAQLVGSKVHDQGASFYGYYTFDFDGPDGALAGMLSIEASSGAAWLHTWHGGFIAEWEAEAMTS